MRIYVSSLSSSKNAIMDSLNQDEADALLVTFYKRGIEKTKEFIDSQLQRLLEGKRSQRYLYIGEGYLAWQYWVEQEPW